MPFYTITLLFFCSIGKMDHFCDKMQSWISVLSVKMLAGLMCTGFEIFIVLPEQFQTQTVLQIIMPTIYMQGTRFSFNDTIHTWIFC